MLIVFYHLWYSSLIFPLWCMISLYCFILLSGTSLLRSALLFDFIHCLDSLFLLYMLTIFYLLWYSSLIFPLWCMISLYYFIVLSSTSLLGLSFISLTYHTVLCYANGYEQLSARSYISSPHAV
ncbi:hypothetical protein BDZ91DRAFT_510002 [Kalaharituber pfeilii]|nr:hypothetical protein BDZ91DRAFT_167357 [Kalaharituber pfeilii]KAF8457063.1 hypothetical protein BDZ91DRAFT_510002 [Kalaharituber pfeilii]